MIVVNACSRWAGRPCLLVFAIRAQTEQLQPVLFDLITGLLRNGSCQRVEVVAFEEFHLPAVLAQQQMLMSHASRDECLASHRLMHALDEMKLLEFFERAIHGDQAERAIFLPCCVKNLDGCEGMCGTEDCIHHCAPRRCDAISVVVQLFQPGFSSHNLLFLILKIIFNNYKEKQFLVKKE